RLLESLLSDLLFRLTATDPLTIALATMLLLAVAALAGWLPAHEPRASSRWLRYDMINSIVTTAKTARRLEDEMFQDLKFGMRMLLKRPGLTLIAAFTLALGIGATTALFSVIYGVLISPYPYAKPGGIWAPGLRNAQTNQQMRPYQLIEYLEMARLPVFADVMATAPGQALLTGEYAPETIQAHRLSGNAFNFLGVPPLLGRTIQPSDIRPNGDPEPVAVLSYGRWQRLFAGDPKAIGKTLRLNDQPYTIIGVMPPRFGWWTDSGVWLPLGTDSRDAQVVFPITRLKQGVSPTAAEEQLHVLQLELAKSNPSGFPKDAFTSQLTNYLDITVASGTMQQSLQLLFVAVGLLLLIACANVANLQLARATARTREIAIRLSMGARRGQIVRQLLTENLMVSLLGGLLGLLFAYWITQLMVALMPTFYVPNEARIEVNRYVLIFCVVVAAMTGILFGLAPALHSSRPDLVTALKDDARTSGASTGGRTRALLVVVEVALSVVLLVGASLTIRSFAMLQKVDLGFRPERVMSVGLPLPPKRYATWEQRNRFARELLERVKDLPGIQAVTIGNGGLPFGGPQSTFAIEGQGAAETRRIGMNLISADYLSALSIPLRRGRMLTEREIDAADSVAVINEAAAKLWPAGEDPIGRRAKLDTLERPGSPNVLTRPNASPYVTIVGVIGNTRNDDIRNDSAPAAFVPYTLLAPSQRTLAVRVQSDSNAIINALRAQVREMDKDQPVNGPTTFDEILGFRTAQPRFIMALFSLFAALGLALAMAGIFSVLSYMVSMRTREIGVRLAMGARPRDILLLIFNAGGRLLVVGLVVGIIASLGVTRLLGSQLELFQARTFDPLSFLGVTVLLVVVTAAACFIPARRATKVDPVVTLRQD
ncbi:MAG: ABC transporter permease, partial [Chloracidobacterium sp.]|nr:ABC transporter permease [Chloracidobacterium sp.]